MVLSTTTGDKEEKTTWDKTVEEPLLQERRCSLGGYKAIARAHFTLAFSSQERRFFWSWASIRTQGIHFARLGHSSVERIEVWSFNQKEIKEEDSKGTERWCAVKENRFPQNESRMIFSSHASRIYHPNSILQILLNLSLNGAKITSEGRDLVFVEEQTRRKPVYSND